MPTPNRSTVIPTMRYNDAPLMIDWLCRVFGFEPRLVVPMDDGSIAHAQLVLGAGMVMLGSTRDDLSAAWMANPSETGGRETRSVCLTVDDADAVCERARAAGANIIVDIHDQPFGGRGFACKDPEGHTWYVGTYDPWAEG